MKGLEGHWAPPLACAWGKGPDLTIARFSLCFRGGGVKRRPLQSMNGSKGPTTEQRPQ